MSDNVVTFPGQFNASRQPQPLSEYEGCSTGYGYARRNRQNPLRQKLRKVEIAVVEVNKVQYQHSSQELELIRGGVEAARILADDLAHAAEPLLRKGAVPETKSTGNDQARTEAVRQMVRQILEEEGLT
jgi:hypothetical protein